jgi:hypothetical protein
MQTILLIVILLMAGYIIFLHIRMAEKNIFIETIVKKVSGIEKDWQTDEMKKFLGEIRKLNIRNTLFENRLFEDKTLNFILENEKDSNIYIHYTRDENDATNILREGFKFIDSFYKTALPVSDDKLDLMIKHNSKKDFGDFLLVLCISNEIVRYYSEELEKTGEKSFFFENILTETPPIKNDNSDMVYLLPYQYVKGYINHRTGEIFNNPGFDREYTSPQFKVNIDRIKKGGLYIRNNDH